MTSWAFHAKYGIQLRTFAQQHILSFELANILAKVAANDTFVT